MYNQYLLDGLLLLMLSQFIAIGKLVCFLLPVAPNVSLVPPSTQVTPTQTAPLTPLMQLSALPYMGMTTTTLLTQSQSMGTIDRRSTGKKEFAEYSLLFCCYQGRFVGMKLCI